MALTFINLQLIAKIAQLRDEAARVMAVLPQIQAAAAEPLVYRKMELFAPISEEVFLILGSAIKDLDSTLVFGASPEDVVEYEEEVKAICSAMGFDFSKLKLFLVKLQEIAKELAPYISVILPFII